MRRLSSVNSTPYRKRLILTSIFILLNNHQKYLHILDILGSLLQYFVLCTPETRRVATIVSESHYETGSMCPLYMFIYVEKINNISIFIDNIRQNVCFFDFSCKNKEINQQINITL